MAHEDRILKLLDELSTNVSTVLEEQHAQRSDIRSIQAMMATKDDLAGAEARLKLDIHALRSEVSAALKTHEERLRNLEERAGISDPTKH